MAETDPRPQKQMEESEEKRLKYFEFVQVAALHAVLCTAKLYDYAKDNSGPLKPSVQSIEGTVKNIVGFVDGSSARRQVSYLDSLPIYIKELIAGGAAGGFAKTAVAPLERTKIVLQKLMRHEGVQGFYKGNGASVLRIVPYAALHFMTYEQYRCWILDNYSAFGTGPIVDLLVGSAAGRIAVLCTYPLDLARTKLAYQVVDPRQSLQNSVGHIYPQPAYTGTRNVIQSVYTEGGVRALYRGVGPTLIGILPYAGLKFYIYEELKRHVPEEHQTSIMMRLSCGALAGLS
ncbi:hypothetical protein ACH5RR_008513 [Cinchona calisaya]|uniref:Uncharacterized protein n=1 Tax=Cinchona calisaya TaxID=153742 RepID=A0ABD3ABN8_9GENT